MISEDLELNKYYTNLIQEVNSLVSAEEEGALVEEKFTELMLYDLSEGGETQNAKVCTNIKEDKIGRKVHKINGYALTENYETLDLFITIYNGGEIPLKVSKAELDKAVSLSTRFLKNALNGYFEEIDEASAVFEIAQVLHKREKELERVNIYILSDGIISADPPTEDNVRDVLINYYVRDLDFFFRLYSSKNKRLAIEIDFKEHFGGAIPCITTPSENPDYQSYLGIISGQTLAAIYKNYGSRLLEQNVRSFLQFTAKINQGIKDTIVSKPHMFLAFNNGIAATAEDVELYDLPEGGKAISKVKDFQIVNGGQTTASIFHTQKKEKDADVSKVFVQLKLTVIKNRENISSIVSQISQYANTQNKVSGADLSSNNPFHIELEKISRTYSAPDPAGLNRANYWFFERARGQYKDALIKEYTPARRKAFELKCPKHQMFQKEDLSKFINSWDMRPYFVARGREKSYAQFIRIITEKKLKPDSVYFEDAVAKAILFKTAEKEYGTGTNKIDDLRSLVVPYTLSWINKITEEKIDLLKIWRNQKVSDELRAFIKDALIYVNNFLKTTAPGTLVREWANKEECWNKLKETKSDLDIERIKKDFINAKTSEKRYKKSDDEILRLEKEAKEEQIRAISNKTWKKIEDWGRQSEKLSPYQASMAFTIGGKVSNKRIISEIELSTGIQILNIASEVAPHLFDDGEDSGEETKTTSISLDALNTLMQWEKKNKKLTDKEFFILRKIVSEGKEPTAFQKKFLNTIIDKAQKKGFSLEKV